MSYKRSRRPIGDNNGSSVSLVQRRRRLGIGAFGDGEEETEILQTFPGQGVPLPSFPSGPATGTFTGVSVIDWFQGLIGGGAPASSTSSADFNSTAVPGVCKATNKPALLAVQELQKQMNRVASVKGFPRIGADGDVGGATMTLFRAVQGASGGTVMGDGSSCMGVAPDVVRITAQVKSLANSLGAPATVAGGAVLSSPSIVTPQGKIQPVSAGILGSMSTVEKLAVVAAIGGAAYVFMGPRRGRRRGR